ncbi:ATP-binding protein [Spirosoma radiotolerans]|uniref:ATP-binding protein n=1 Tax=Spirosoma radiotolerans TaxID=1379870 RepID=UPI000A5BD1DE|nr:ATP-binding protein [Spirosoma radiotolerans]
MAKLTVKNVGPIKEAELEVKKHTVFIGPQGSGKSTLAKLIAILSSRKSGKFTRETFRDYNIHNYITPNSTVSFYSSRFQAIIRDGSLTYSVLDDEGKVLAQDSALPDIESKPADWPTDQGDMLEALQKISELTPDIQTSELLKNLLSRIKKLPNVWRSSGAIVEEYIPSERMLLSVLSNSLWSLVNAHVDFPATILAFASKFESVRNQIVDFHIPFLNITFEHIQGKDILIHANGRIDLNQSASGYQSIFLY